MDDYEAEPEVETTKRLQEQMELVLQMETAKPRLKKGVEIYQSKDYVPFSLIKEIHDVISNSGGMKIYLHELLDDSSLHLPEYKPPPRDPELEARIQKLKAEQENRKYEEMVRNISVKKQDNMRVGEDMKELNKQMLSVANFVITVGAAFAFGYKGTEYAVSGPNKFAFQLMAGLILGTIVFFADLYFLVKYS